MSQKTIYVLHKNGAPSHYYGLAHLCKQNNLQIAYREFSVFSQFFKGIVKGNLPQVHKQLINAGFMISLLLSSNKKIVLGIAPFDPKLKTLLWVLKKHKVYYHTSWTCWDKTFHPKNKNNTPEVFQTWSHFLEQITRHIFAVTQKTKNELLDNYDIKGNNISVVYHSLHPEYSEYHQKPKVPNSFIYLGRLTPAKGIVELLEFFADNPGGILTIVGDGEEENLVKEYAAKHANIHFKGYSSNKKEIIGFISSHEYLVLNSKRTAKWEELFGLIIIEAMSQGTLPIGPTHSGPTEIIKPEFGILFEEGTIKTVLKRIVEEPFFSEEKSKLAIANSKAYKMENISTYWEAILES